MTTLSVKIKYNIATYNNLKLNYWGIPKCGNTSIKYILYSANNKLPIRDMVTSDVYQWVHNDKHCKFITPKIAMENGYKNFTVVRDPVARFKSMYADFMFKRPTMGTGGASKRFVKTLKQIKQNPHPDALLELLELCQDDERNIHFRSQAGFLLSSDIVPLKLETIKNTLNTIHPGLSGDVQLHSTGNIKIPPFGVTITEQIKSVFKDDFIIWDAAL